MTNTTTAPAALTGEALIKANALALTKAGVTAANVIGDALDSKKARIATALAAPVVTGSMSGRKACDDAGISLSTGQRRIALGTALLALPEAKRTNALATTLEPLFDKVRDGREGLTVSEVKAALRKCDGRKADDVTALLTKAAEAKQAKAVAALAEAKAAAAKQAEADGGSTSDAAAKAAEAKAKAAMSPRDAVTADLAVVAEALLRLTQQGNLSDVLALIPEQAEAVKVVGDRIKALQAVSAKAARVQAKAAEADAKAAEALAATTAEATAKAEAEAEALTAKVAATVAADAKATPKAKGAAA